MSFKSGVKGRGSDRWWERSSEQNEVDGMKKGADSTGEVMHVPTSKSGWW